MATSTPPTAVLLPGIYSSTSILQQKATISAFSIATIFHKASIKRRRKGLARASKPRQETPNSKMNTDPEPAFISQEDVRYLIKLLAGSVVGAAAIKYGSIIFPEVTKPNIFQAMTMIFAPVVVAVLLLIRQSSSAD